MRMQREEVCIIYLAHITEDKTKEQGIAAHLTETAQLSGDFAQAFACRDLAGNEKLAERFFIAQDVQA